MFYKNQIIINKESFGYGYDECTFETKYIVLDINDEKEKIKIQKIARRTTVRYGNIINEDFHNIIEKPFWAKVSYDNCGHCYLRNDNKRFGTMIW